MGNLSLANFPVNPSLPFFPTLMPLQSLFQSSRPAPIMMRPPLANAQDQVSVPAQASQGRTLSSVSFVAPAEQLINLPAALAEVQSLSDPGVRLGNYKNLLADLIEDKDFDSAIKLFGAARIDKVLPAGGAHAMYKILNQSLLEADLYDQAITLNTGYGDAKVKEEVRKEIVSYLISEGKTLQAAQVNGKANFTGVARAELERLGKGAKILGKDIYELWRRTVIGISLGEQIAENAEHDAEAGKQYRLKSLEYGNLACAYTVSRILDRTRLDDQVDSAECNTLASQLKKSGFAQVGGDRSMKPVARNFDYKEGDIVFFTRKNKGGYGHVGVIAKVEGDKVWMVQNSSAKRQVVEVQLNNYQRPVVAVLRPPEK